MQKFKFSYDRENDDLFLYNPKSKSKRSVEIGDLVLDYNSKKELVGIQILNASKFIKDFVDVKGSSIKDILNNLEECKVDVKAKSNMLIIKIYLHAKEKDLSPVISVPRIVEKSPALASA